MSNSRKIIDYFKKPQETPSTSSMASSISASTQPSADEAGFDGQIKRQRVEGLFVNTSTLQRDPGLRPPIWEYREEYHDEIRRFYISSGAYQVRLKEFPFTKKGQRRRFQASWYDQYNWLEYSPTTDAAYCLPCYVFAKKVGGHSSNKSFTLEGFRAWKKGSGKESAFLTHEGSSTHQIAVKYCERLMKSAIKIGTRLNIQSSEQIAKNRLWLQVSIDAVRYLAFQSFAFGEHVGHSESSNGDNFLELIRFISKYNEKVAEVFSENVSKDAIYTSPELQKEIVTIWAKRVRSKIREDIGDSKFCIIVDKVRNESITEQMGLVVIRFVDQEGFIRERFLDLVDVKDTAGLTLKEAISIVLSRSCLSIQDIRGQGYDGSSNMRDGWNELQALFVNDCSSAHYVHSMAHRLDLTLVAASRDIYDVHQFFENLKFIINLVGASCERNDELQEIQAANEFAYLIEMNELESERGLNQIGTLQRVGDSLWSSHFNFVCSLKRMFGPAQLVLENLCTRGADSGVRGDANAALEKLMSFEFVFILHAMERIMEITDILCQALQKETQDMKNVISCVHTTKKALQDLKENGWDTLIEDVKSFCENQEVDIPDMSKQYSKRIGRSRLDYVTFEHHYRFDIFTAVVDSQMSELGSRFSHATTELFTLVQCFDPRNGYASFDKDKISTLAEKFYPNDFTELERCQLQNELLHFEVDISRFDVLKNLPSISELCRTMVVSRKAGLYTMIHRLICLVLTLPISTATTKRASSPMQIVKTKLRNKVEDDFLSDCLLLYYEKELAGTFSTEMLIDDFFVKHPWTSTFGKIGARSLVITEAEAIEF